MIDRRAGNERRRNPRYAVNIDINWENAEGRHRGTMSDVSVEGCFVLCSGNVGNGDRIRVFLPVGEGMKVQFSGEVVNYVYEIGFAIKFIDLGAAQRDFLEQFINSLESSGSSGS